MSVDLSNRDDCYRELSDLLSGPMRPSTGLKIRVIQAALKDISARERHERAKEANEKSKRELPLKVAAMLHRSQATENPYLINAGDYLAGLALGLGRGLGAVLREMYDEDKGEARESAH